MPVDNRNNGNQHDIGEEDQQTRHLSDLHNILHVDTSKLHSVAFKVNVQRQGMEGTYQCDDLIQ